MSIEIANESGVAVDEAGLAALARHVLDGMRVHPLAELSVLLVDEAAMADLHQRWMGEEGPTDVLSFPMDEIWPPPPGGSQAEHDGDDVPGLLGDVVLCPQVAIEQARKAEHSVQEELDLLCTHGILHLLGYDHAEPEEHAAMFGLQDRLLAAWNSERDAGGRAGPDDREPGSARPGRPVREAQAERQVEARPEERARQDRRQAGEFGRPGGGGRAVGPPGGGAGD
jgi:probable rRNA maturation factor